MSTDAQTIGTQSLAVKAALAGGNVGQSSWVAPWSPYCDNPLRIERRITSRQARHAKFVGKAKLVDDLKALEVAIDVPCRRCAKCLQFRQNRWRERAAWEIERAYQTGHRTWWMCLTFSPIHLAGITMAARSTSLKDVDATAYRDVQKYFKRLRKGKAEFRYLAIMELGDENDRMHYHLLLHEKGSNILKETLEDLWPSNVWARLLGSEDASRTASYITKYATKSLDIRPRASSKYGQISFTLNSKNLGEQVT